MSGDDQGPLAQVLSMSCGKTDTGEAATTTLTGVHLDKAARRACAFPDNAMERAARLISR